MTIIEAIKTGRPFKAPEDKCWMVEHEGEFYLVDPVDGTPNFEPVFVRAKCVLRTDWEAKP